MSDEINHPKHYNAGKIEVIDVIEDWKLSFCLGNTVKYIGRAGKKDPSKFIQDLEKAQWYLAREVARLTKEADARVDAELVERGADPAWEPPVHFNCRTRVDPAMFDRIRYPVSKKPVKKLRNSRKKK